MSTFPSSAINPFLATQEVARFRIGKEVNDVLSYHWNPLLLVFKKNHHKFLGEAINDAEQLQRMIDWSDKRLKVWG